MAGGRPSQQDTTGLRRTKHPTGSVAERQILCDSINVGGAQPSGLSQRPATFRTFALKQMASAGAAEKYFAGAGQLETFGH